MFSSRTPERLEPNSLFHALERARAAARPLIDLTLTNPTEAGIEFPPAIFAPLSTPAVAAYRPQPFGLRAARAAVAADYARRGAAIDPDRIVLTASTSEAYSLLFKLLCAPSGDSVLVPAPSYPLFEHLTRLDGVTPVAYRLDYDVRWRVNLDSVDAAWQRTTRALLAVSPNNPTGSIVTPPELAALAGRCASRDAALIVDEVFADYPLDRAADREDGDTAVTADPPCLLFRLGGLSKSAGLPQLKLGWIAVEGPDAIVAHALQRLELICDTYLSVSTPVQVAAPDLIAAGAGVRRQIAARVRENYDELRRVNTDRPAVEVLPAEAGWSAVLRSPARGTEEEIMLDLLERDAVVVHPGFFFDFPREAFFVFSLLPPLDVFRDGVQRVMEYVGE